MFLYRNAFYYTSHIVKTHYKIANVAGLLIELELNCLSDKLCECIELEFIIGSVGWNKRNPPIVIIPNTMHQPLPPPMYVIVMPVGMPPAITNCSL